jgi:hypothetical protein
MRLWSEMNEIRTGTSRRSYVGEFQLFNYFSLSYSVTLFLVASPLDYWTAKWPLKHAALRASVFISDVSANPIYSKSFCLNFTLTFDLVQCSTADGAAYPFYPDMRLILPLPCTAICQIFEGPRIAIISDSDSPDPLMGELEDLSLVYAIL